MADGKVVYKVVGDTSQLASDMGKAEGVIRSAVGAWDGIVAGAVAGIGAAFAGAVAAGGTALAALGKQGLEYNAQMEKYRTGFTTLLGDAEKAAAIMEQIKLDAAITPFDVAGLTQAVQLLVSADIKADSARDTILALGDAIAATGGGDDELRRMAQNLQQVSNTGKASAVDVKQFAMAGINIYKVLADYLGITAKEAAEMEVTFEVLQKALIAAAAEGGMYFGAMANQSQTLNGAVSNLGDSFGQFSGRVTENLSRAAVGVVNALTDMLNSMSPFEAAITAVFDAIADGVTERIPMIKDGLDRLGEAVGLIIPKLSDISGLLPNISNEMQAISPSAEALSGIIPALAEAVTGLLKPLESISLKTLPATKEAFKSLSTELIVLSNDLLPTIARFVGELVASLAQLGLNLLPTIFNAVSTLIKPLGDIAKDIMPALNEVVDAAAPILEAVFKNAVEPIANAIAKIFPMLSEIAKVLLLKIAELIERIRPGIEKITEAFKPLIEAIGEFIAETLRLISDALEPFIDLLDTVLGPVLDEEIKKFEMLVEVLIMIAEAICNEVIRQVESLTSAVKFLSEFLTKVFTGDVKGAFEMVASAVGSSIEKAKGILTDFVSFVQGVVSSISSALSSIGSAVSSAISTAKSLLSGELSAGKVVGSIVGNVNKALTGGDEKNTDAPGTLPGSSSPAGFYSASAAAAASSGASYTSASSSRATVINTTVELDGRAVGQSTMTYLDDTASTTVRGN